MSVHHDLRDRQTRHGVPTTEKTPSKNTPRGLNKTALCEASGSLVEQCNRWPGHNLVSETRTERHRDRDRIRNRYCGGTQKRQQELTDPKTLSALGLNDGDTPPSIQILTHIKWSSEQRRERPRCHTPKITESSGRWATELTTEQRR